MSKACKHKSKNNLKSSIHNEWDIYFDVHKFPKTVPGNVSLEDAVLIYAFVMPP